MFSSMGNSVIKVSDCPSMASQSRDLIKKKKRPDPVQFASINISAREISICSKVQCLKTYALNQLATDSTFIANLRPLDAYALGVLYNCHQDKMKVLDYMRKVYSVPKKYMQEMGLEFEKKRVVSVVKEYEEGCVSKISLFTCSGNLKKEMTCQDLIDNPALFIGLTSEESFHLGYAVGKCLH